MSIFIMNIQIFSYTNLKKILNIFQNHYPVNQERLEEGMGPWYIIVDNVKPWSQKVWEPLLYIIRLV